MENERKRTYVLFDDSNIPIADKMIKFIQDIEVNAHTLRGERTIDHCRFLRHKLIVMRNCYKDILWKKSCILYDKPVNMDVIMELIRHQMAYIAKEENRIRKVVTLCDLRNDKTLSEEDICAQMTMLSNFFDSMVKDENL